MDRRDFIKNAAVLGAAGFISQSVLAGVKDQPTAAKRPNIVFFLVDDMGWQDTSEPFHTEITDLNKRYYTPNMVTLARQGVKFTQAYACSVCSPTRVSLMTGLNSARHRVTNWTLRQNTSPDWKHPTLDMPAWNVNGLSPVAGIERTVHAKTLPMFLRDAGYRTIHVGKAHFGADGLPGEMPENLGFDVNIAGHCAGGPGSYYAKNNFSAAFRNGDRIWDIPGLDKYHGKDMYLNEALTIEAKKAMDDAVQSDKPFYLYMSHYAIHAPYEADDRHHQKYKDAGLDKFDATYASMIESMDKSLGDILDNVKKLGIKDNTIIVFMTDNGAPSGADINKPLRGHKLTPYEGGSRVPMIVNWPGVTKADSVCDDYMIIEDIFPTFLEMAGINDYHQIGGKIDGVSIVPLLKRTDGYPKNRSIFWHFPHNYSTGKPHSAIRRGDWKLIYFHTDLHYELYNLKDDIGESNNLATDRKDITKRLAKELADFLEETNANMPIYKDTGKSVPLPA